MNTNMLTQLARSGDAASAVGERPLLALAGSYTLDPLLEPLEFWTDLLRLNLQPTLAPYAQMFQQLLDPDSMLRRNRLGINVLLFRWSDLTAPNAREPGWEDVMARVTEVANALQSFEHRVPCLVLIGPASAHRDVSVRATEQLRSLLAGTANVHVQAGEHNMALYRVQSVADAVAERVAHVPYSTSALAVLATAIVRWYVALTRAPVKMIAVDGDHTLWAGAVAEDGCSGIRIDPGHVALQNALLEQNRSGRLLCLLSKNEDSDVRDLFACNKAMRLPWSGWAATRIDWSPKPSNLREVCSQLGLGLDSVLFLDDNPIECAAMRAACPQVMSIQVPTDDKAMQDFVDHLWLFDRTASTAEDLNRARMYQDQAARFALRKSTQSLKEFLDGLELDVAIAPARPDDLERLAQLCQRTNQFNTSLVRYQAHELRDVARCAGGFHYAVRARDRFGDYGIVGQLLGQVCGDALELSLVTLSCRALGRGIEHRMLAAAGKFALDAGATRVVVRFRRGERNGPAEQFLQGVFNDQADADCHRFGMAADDAAKLVFDPSAGSDQLSEPGVEPTADMAHPVTAVGAALIEPALTEHYQYIAHTLTSGANVEMAMASRVRPRPDLHTGFVTPSAAMEREIATIWEKVLRTGPVGAHDHFQDLGGKSIHLVQVHSLLHQRLKIPLEIATLFQHPTVASLAAHLSGAAPLSATGIDARHRGNRMREARVRAANRSGMVK
ncbi:MAG: hypothetical protein CVV14_04125 [Gammaproteobacteria bacterium HGW-Gammaproteobacteria-4]|jgi:FkbH-like protein|nr:MAG: hypothetical protein CVV14_04125 [Gammaproteobacteria bacterium HGW-Gammaproteobacteria-4]